MSITNWKSLLDFRKRTLIQKVVLVVIVACSALFLTAFSLYAQLHKDVSVILAGEEVLVRTQAKTVQELLEELEVNYSAHDYIYPELDTPLQTGLLVEWKQALPVKLDLYGHLEQRWTTTDTVAEFMREQKLTLKEGDQLVNSVREKIHENMFIEIAHFTEEIVTEEEVIPYQTIRRNDPNLIQGEQKVTTKGKDGQAVHTIKVSYKNSEEIERKVISTQVVEEKRDELVAVGTLTTVSRGSYVLTPKAVLENVTLTAYSAGAEHTGKTPDHPQYGLTRSGTRAKDGETIAVDPKLIPLGTWVYIDGIGLRRAEDTGGAVRGKKIDLYYEDNEEANNFGLQKGYTVFVLGKQKPKSVQ